MFTGIVEDLGCIEALEQEQENLNIKVSSKITPTLKIDQSVAHNGVCLTVTKIEDNCYWVTAIKETLDKTNIKGLKVNQIVNLERAMKLGDRLDGHIVQGHVDQTGTCINIREEEGSWRFTFEYSPAYNNMTIEKGSITINGVSLTVVDSKDYSFSVAIIPYTFEHTNFKTLNTGDAVNLEFDVLGKYVQKMHQMQK
ncbi:MAG: riboflavin synthase subunit alpha [Bacteroidetes bacterium MedPE-SWsnd-G2]|nr:MAG: riboflavin synthase subunit alpha [Bacteroidetes bacterium MedPE-SWsnd-G2]